MATRHDVRPAPELAGRGHDTFTDLVLANLRDSTSTSWVEYWSDPETRTRMSYADLAEDAERVAVWLAARGRAPGSTAVLAFAPGLDFVRGVLGALHAGLVIAPIPLVTADDVYAKRRLARIVEEAHDCMILCDEAGRRTCEEVCGSDVVLVLPGRDTVPPESTVPWTPPQAAPDDLVVLQYTSGSTGDPKGVEITQRNLVENQSAIAEVTRTRLTDVIAGWLPHYHDMGLVGQFLHAFAAGCSLAFTSPAQFLRRPVLWLRIISERAATISVGPDFAFALVARLVRPEKVFDLDLTALRTLITGSEPVRWASMRAFSELVEATGFDPAAFRPSYGMAETTLVASGREPEGRARTLRASVQGLSRKKVRWAEADEEGVVLVSCGFPSHAADLRVVDTETGVEVGEGLIGEIIIRAPWVARGYRGHPRTPSDFGFRLPGSTEEYYRTGDLGTLLDGRLYVTGRSKEVIILRGRNVFPQDVEQSALDTVGPRATGTAAAFETDGGVGLVVELRPPWPPEQLDRMRREVADRVRELVGVSDVEVVFGRPGSLPKTSSGKVQRTAVRDHFREKEKSA